MKFSNLQWMSHAGKYALMTAQVSRGSQEARLMAFSSQMQDFVEAVLMKMLAMSLAPSLFPWLPKVSMPCPEKVVW